MLSFINAIGGIQANTLKFYWNGIKESGGKLQLCSYSESELLNFPKGTITIYGRHYRSFSAGIKAAFTVTNGSEMMSDYFENDSIRVEPTHPLYAEVKAACDKKKEHDEKRWAKRLDGARETQAILKAYAKR